MCEATLHSLAEAISRHARASEGLLLSAGIPATADCVVDPSIQLPACLRSIYLVLSCLFLPAKDAIQHSGTWHVQLKGEKADP